MKTLLISLVLPLIPSFVFAQNFWQQTSLSGVVAFVIAPTPDGDLVAATNQGLHKSTDMGTSWTMFDSSFYVSDRRRFAMSPNGSIFVATGTGVQRTTDMGSTWILVRQTSNIIAMTVNSSGHVFFSTISNIYRSTDNGSTWTQIVTGFNAFCFGVQPTTGYILAWTDSGLYRSTNNGLAWYELPTRMTSFVRAFGMRADGYIFAASAGVYRSTDNGVTFLPMNNGLLSSSASSFAFNSRGHVFVGSHGGFVSRSENSGESWKRINSGMWSPITFDITSTPDDYIYAATEGAVFRSVGPTTAVKDLSSNSPTSFVLEQNYPNPFNPTTRIAFTLPSQSANTAEGRERVGSHVTLKVYDLLGREVATMVNEEMKPGRYEVAFNAEGLASGTYFYRIQAGALTQTRKLLLLR
ncbi:MAG: hypothetical protein HW407_1789 [Bacteroidetes bacterium]|nr:hypothetical protein [Bacteroidota bacterium]